MDFGQSLACFNEASFAPLQKLPESDWRDPCSAEPWLVEMEGYRKLKQTKVRDIHHAKWRSVTLGIPPNRDEVYDIMYIMMYIILI